MKKIFPLASFLLLSAGVAETRAASVVGDSVYNGLKIHTVNFIFPKDWNGLPNDTVAWSTIHQTLINNKEAEIYIPAKLEINCDETRANAGCLLMDSVGVRYKGNSTFSSGGNKRPFRVSFDEYGIDQRWNGIKGFTLNNSWSDPSHMREKIHMDYAVVRAGMPGPRMAYANVKVNGKAHSFYMMGELADSRMLKRFFDENAGDLFKAIDGLSNNSDFTTTSFNSKRYEVDSDSVDRAWARLGVVISAVNGSNAAVDMPARINMNALYRALGTDILFASMDSYIRAAQNYLVYFPEAGGSKMEWVLWDASLSFGAVNVGSPSGTGTACTNSATVSILCGVTGRPLLNKFVTTTALKDDYLRSLWFHYNAYYAGSWISSRIDSVAAVIRPHVNADAKKLTSISQFDSDVTNLKNFVTNRQASVTSQFATQGISAANAIRNGDIVINEIAPAQGWVEVYNPKNYAIDLSGHSLSNDAAQPNKWSFPAESFVEPLGRRVIALQGGTTGVSGPANFTLSTAGGYLRLSRANGTVVDSVTFGAQNAQRTIGRATDGAATFTPGIPTPGLSNVDATGLAAGLPAKTVVINEFMADNDTIASPAAIKADWIELYNTTGSPVFLTDMYLSDNANNPAKWQFPADASVPANGYLMVWAYDTTVAGSLFARWALSKDGEHIRLSNTDLSVVDSVTFGPQTKNRTLSRIPNGSGGFQGPCVPTPGAANVHCNTTLASRIGAADPAFSVALTGGRATVRVRLEEASSVRLSLVDSRGREVVRLLDGRFAAGEHAAFADASRLSPGAYLFRLQAGGRVFTRAVVLLR